MNSLTLQMLVFSNPIIDMADSKLPLHLVTTELVSDSKSGFFLARTLTLLPGYTTSRRAGKMSLFKWTLYCYFTKILLRSSNPLGEVVSNCPNPAESLLQDKLLKRGPA